MASRDVSGELVMSGNNSVTKDPAVHRSNIFCIKEILFLFQEIMVKFLQKLIIINQFPKHSVGSGKVDAVFLVSTTLSIGL